MNVRRREARIHLVQTLFQHGATNSLNVTPKELQATFNQIADRHNPNLVNNAYAFKVLESMVDKLPEIDALIEKSATNWNLETMGIVDKSILRLGIFELLFGEPLEVPGLVALNEAIELSKLFLTDGGTKFINGVLDVIYKELDKPPSTQKKKVGTKYAAAALVYYVEDAMPNFLFVQDAFDTWTLPKGSILLEEDPKVALKKILKTKFSLDVTVLESIGSNAYTSHPPEGPKQVHTEYFLAEAAGSTEVKLLGEQKGIQSLKWVRGEAVKNLHLYKDVSNLLLGVVRKIIERYEK